MHYMVMLVLDDVDSCPAVFDAWEAAGTKGITILESTGLGRVRRAMSMRSDLPLMPSLRSLLQSREERHRTLISVVESEELADKLIEATQEITGDLEAANRGVIFVLPVLKAVGLAREEPNAAPVDPPKGEPY